MENGNKYLSLKGKNNFKNLNNEHFIHYSGVPNTNKHNGMLIYIGKKCRVLIF